MHIKSSLSKNRRCLRRGDNFVNTSNFSKMIFMKLSLKPQNNDGFQKNCRHFGVFKDGSQKLFDSILKKIIV